MGRQLKVLAGKKSQREGTRSSASQLMGAWANPHEEEASPTLRGKTTSWPAAKRTPRTSTAAFIFAATCRLENSKREGDLVLLDYDFIAEPIPHVPDARADRRLGYIGCAVGSRLPGPGTSIWLRRNAAAENESNHSAYSPSSQTQPLRPICNGSAPDYDWVINIISSGGGTASDYRQIYLQTAHNLIDWLTPKPSTKLVYTSTVTPDLWSKITAS